MRTDLTRVFAETLLQSLHKVEEVLHAVLLLANGTLVARLVHHIVKDVAWVHVALVRVQQLGEEELHLFGHLLTDSDTLKLHLILWVSAPRRLSRNIVQEEFAAHVGQEEEGLDE